MTELSRSLLAAAREGLAPDPAVAARVRAKIAAATGVAATAGTVAAVVVPKTSAAATLIKITAALLAIGAVATIIAVAQPEESSPTAAQLEVSAVEPSDDIRTEVRVVAPNDPSATPAVKPPHALPTRHIDMPDDVARSAVVGSRADEASFDGPKHPRATKVADDPFDSISLSREVELIDLAMVSLRKNVPHAALEAIKAYKRETGGRGQMAEDAAAIEIEARCLQDMDVEALLARFDTQWPESAQRERIQTTCYSRK
jgi:hypothetical protein